MEPLLSPEDLESIVAVNHCQPDGKIMQGLVPVLEGIIKARDEEWQRRIQEVVEARYAGDFAPILPKLIELSEKLPDTCKSV